jgi:EmrB/QacA subfamily drug resistance transporter
MTDPEERKRWLALSIVCIGTLMIVLDTTIVNVALPSIRADLGFDETSLVWVINAYMLTFGGFLLLGGRLGDLYGHRRLFVGGLAVFTVASLVCGLATTQAVLIGARAVQGFGGAIVDAIALSLIMNLFETPAGRAKAMGVYGFVCAAGGSIGVLLGGILTHALSWHWVFLVNIPIGIMVAILCFTLLPATRTPSAGGRLDVAGAITVTVALMLAVYAIVDGNHVGWTSMQTIGRLAGAVAVLGTFVAIESRVASPLMPLRLFSIRQVVGANAIGVLWAAGMFAWFFLSALYLQVVLGYDAREVGLAFLPSNVIMAIFSVGVSAKLVNRFGLRGPLWVGLACSTVGLAWFARAPVAGDFWIDVLPGMLLSGVGAGMALNPLILAAMSDVEPSESGVASGIVNTAFMMGGALGLAVLASAASARTEALTAMGVGEIAALNGGYHAAFAAGAVASGIAALLARLRIRASGSDRHAGQ